MLTEWLQGQLSLLVQSDAKVLAAFVFFFFYSMACAVPLPGTRFLAIGAGAVFPLSWAFALVFMGALAGASLGFWMVRIFFQDRFLNFLTRKHPKLTKGLQFFDENSYTALLSLRFSPIVPFSLVHGLMAITSMAYFPFLAITGLGALLYTSLWVFSGGILRELFSDEGIGETVKSWPLMLGLLALSLVPILLKWWTGSRRTNFSQDS